MRKIVPKHDEEKRKKRNQIIVGGVLMLVMLISVLGYAFQGQSITPTGNSNTTTYNGITFTDQNGFWTTIYKSQRLVFTYQPAQISFNTSNLTKSITDFSNKPLYIYSSDYNAESEIKINLTPFASNIQDACPTGQQCANKSIISKDCTNNFIIIQESPIPSIEQQQSCIFISGQGQDLIAVIDGALFKIFGVKQ